MAKLFLSKRLLLTFVLVGCGGEDFSTPPANLADIRSRASKEDNHRAGAELSQTAQGDSPSGISASAPGGSTNDQTEQNSRPQNSLLPKAQPGGETASDQSVADSELASLTQPTMPVPETDTRGPDADFTRDMNSEPERVDAESQQVGQDFNHKKDPVEPQQLDLASDIDGQVVAVGKKSGVRKEGDVNTESATGEGMSLLEKLKADSTADASDPKPSAAETIVTKTGRNAVAAEIWFRLQNQLAQRFFVATTPDGRKIASTSGARSLDVLTTRIDTPAENPAESRRPRMVAAVATAADKVITQSVVELPAIISSIELIKNGDVVLIGTEDGRLIARSCANLQDWDIYAQDLSAFQEEHRPMTKISDSAVVVVRALDERRILTIDRQGIALIWATDVAVRQTISPLNMSDAQARESEAPVERREPIAQVELPNAPVLSVSMSATGKYAAVTTSDEVITVFQTDDGRVVASVTAAELDDSQPACVQIEEPSMRLLVGLADGRIVRRAMPDGAVPTKVNSDDIDPGFEVVFAPDVSDQNGPITTMQLGPDGTSLYFGRLSGLVTHFDLQHKQLYKAEQSHTAPVVEIRSTATGLLTIGHERAARFSPKAVDARPQLNVQAFRLSSDPGLEARKFVEAPESLKQNNLSVRRKFDSPATNAESQPLAFAAIRPADPVLTLYEYQLRVAEDTGRRATIREKILALNPRGRNSAEEERYETDSARQIAELQTEFDFRSRPLRRAVMSLSDDGNTIAAAQFRRTTLIGGAAAAQPVLVWDTPTGTRLRSWGRSGGMMDLTVNFSSGLIIPAPLTARMNLYSGEVLHEENPVFVSQMSHGGDVLATGVKGSVGAAMNMVHVQNVSSGRRATGVEAFEGIVTAIAWSADDRSLFLSVRERSRVRLIELEPVSLQPRAELEQLSPDDQWNVNAFDPERGFPGATAILPSPSGRILAIYGRYGRHPQPFQIRLWKRSGESWPEQPDAVLSTSEPMLETEMTNTQMAFVDGQDNLLAVVSPKGVATINTRTGSVADTLELPDVGGHRPATMLSPDGKWLFAGDAEGNVWVWSLRSISRTPQKFAAQAGPLTGLAMSPNSQFLATAGEENRIRIWDMSGMLSPPIRTSNR